MLHKYFKFSKARCVVFGVILVILFAIQYFLTGSLVSQQQITTEAGNNSSSVIGILDDTEVIRQKFAFDRKVDLNAFTISFGSFKKKSVGDTVHFQMTDGNNDIVFETSVPVRNIKANADYIVNMDHSVTIPKGVSCCIRITCSSKSLSYETIPTVNTTNRTNPNTYMSTLKMQTHAKSINISYSYSYRQIYPLFVLIAEIILLALLCFERVTSYSELYRKRREKLARRKQREDELIHERMENRKAHGKKNATEEIGKNRKRQKAKNAPKHHRDFSIKNMVKYCISEPKFIRTLRIIIAVINPLVLSLLLETMNGTSVTIYANVWIFTWILLGGIELILIAIIGNNSIAMLVMDLVLFPVGLANLFIMNVRGTPFLPSDILGVQTGMEVASTYTFSLTPAQFIVIPALFIWCIILFRTKPLKTKQSWKKRGIKSGASIVTGILIIGILYNTSILNSCGIKDNVWNKVSSCKANGFYMNYFINFHYLKVSAPAGYSEDKVEEILADMTSTDASQSTVASSSAINASGGGSVQGQSGNKVLGNSDLPMNTTLNGKKPNIILIMNESLADFTLIGDMKYNKDPLPFIHSMSENTIKGLDYVSVFGAGTSNSEFEAMTGNTMKFFPSGSNVYQQFMHDSTFSLPSYLKELGYRCDAIHPSSGANWNRVATYNSMKFDQFLTIEDFKNPEYVRYISDKESYKKVIELYEKKDKGPMYVFDMTIQNHGGYLTNTNWDDPVCVEDSYYTQAKEYLSAIHVSDQAFQYLIEYFEKQEEPTVICMFGDHFPSIEESFYEELLGKSQSDWKLEDIQKRYAAPFVLWANYDIAEADNIVLGNNYLENVLLKQAGISLPLYNQYIEKVSESIPAMNVNGYMDTDGTWHNYGQDETDNIAKLLDNYEILQYGYYSDMNKEKMSELFQMAP